MAGRRGRKESQPKLPALSRGTATDARSAPRASFLIVGIGASAGGLEAFERFFLASPDIGMAFVLVPHLDPSHASILAEILQRSTTMSVLEAQDQAVVEPGKVYVIPPNRDMAVLGGRLQISVPDAPRGQRMPIDSFLRSLAEDQGERAVGIVLSGTGSDGTLGLRSIVGVGGLSLVQDPATAKYDGMPSSALRAGYATKVLPVEAMPAALLAYEHRVLVRHQSLTATASTGFATGLSKVLMLLRSVTGHDFSLYKKSTVGRRIERRMALRDLDDIDIYIRYLKEHPAELQILFRELLIKVTNFFRNPEAFEVLKADVLPLLLAGKPSDYVFRVWVTGCASGEEAYSIAIVLREFMDETEQEFKVQIYGTDLDDDAIAVARAGCYPPNIVADVAPERLRRFFVKENACFRITKSIRETVVFATQNVIKDPPFTKLDLLSCRNLMIYLEPELQHRLIASFHYALKPDGVLFLSPSESIGNHPDLFCALDRKWKFYLAKRTGNSVRKMMASGLSWAKTMDEEMTRNGIPHSKHVGFLEVARRVLFQAYAPPSVIADLKGNILFVHGETSKYLRPAPGHATLNVIEMAGEGLRLQLRAAVAKAIGQGKATLSQNVCVKSKDQDHAVSVSVRVLREVNAGADLLLVSFQDVLCPMADKRRRAKHRARPADVGRVEELVRELIYTRANLKAIIEEQQAANEELKSANEEMQSTNEELETSREELHSVNEELTSVNSELQAKIEQLTEIQNDMKNLFDNINVGTVFLDENMLIRRFTREATEIYHLVTTDIGRPLADIKCDLEEEQLLTRAQAVLDTLIPWQSELRSRDGRWFQARIQPYRTLDNVIGGVVLTFVDITLRVEIDAREQKARQLMEGVIDTVCEPLLVLDQDFQVVGASRSFYRHFHVVAGDTLGHPLFSLGNGQWNIPALRELLENVLPRDQSFDGFVVDHVFPGIGRCRLRLNARRVFVGAGEAPMILLAMSGRALDQGNAPEPLESVP